MSNSENKISVSACVVTHNSKGDIGDCLRSVFGYTKGVDIRVYISDNLSDDGTVDYVKTEFPSVNIIENKLNNGFGWGHNKLIPLIDSKYHVIINPDVTFDNDVISELVDYMENNPQVGMVTPKIFYPDGTLQSLPKKLPTIKYILGSRIHSLDKYRREYTMADVKMTEPIDIECCTGCFMVIRTDIFKQLGGFDDRYFMYLEDMDLSQEVINKAKKSVVFYPYTYIYHAWHRASKKRWKFTTIHIISMIKFFLKWKYIR